MLSVGTIAYRGAFFGRGNGPIYLERFRCNDGDAKLMDCALPPIGLHDCDHSQDAGVTCVGEIVSLYSLESVFFLFYFVVMNTLNYMSRL